MARSPTIKFDVKGDRKLMKALDRLPKAVGRRIVPAAVLFGGRHLAREMKSRVADGPTGNLGESIVAEIVSRSGLRVLVQVGASTTKGRKGFHAHLVEYGTEPHQTVVDTKQVLAAEDGSIFGRVAEHPGSAPKPFARPAWDEERVKVLTLIRRKLWDGIRREAGRLRVRA
ncbi:MAG: HK97 gp10 family phage protein [bacterium]|nr:HK97 gp10 family phage protein [bacterium]